MVTGPDGEETLLLCSKKVRLGVFKWGVAE
jgi:hypothetical protein